MSIKMIYQYSLTKPRYKCLICKYSTNVLNDFCKHIEDSHKIILSINTSEQKNIINTLNINNNLEDDLCVICLDQKKTTAFFRCGHKICCYKCAKKILESNDKDLKKCPVCRKIVGGILRIYD